MRRNHPDFAGRQSVDTVLHVFGQQNVVIAQIARDHEADDLAFAIGKDGMAAGPARPQEVDGLARVTLSQNIAALVTDDHP
jgi:hypothetical protein